MLTTNAVLAEWVAALNARDAARVTALYHDDAENLQGARGTPVHGAAAIREDFADFFRRTPDAWIRAERSFEHSPWSVLEWTAGGTYAGDDDWLPGPFTVRGCGFFRIEEGRIRCQRGYYDQYKWYTQDGLAVN